MSRGLEAKSLHFQYSGSHGKPAELFSTKFSPLVVPYCYLKSSHEN